jgi:hypothetical protein
MYRVLTNSYQVYKFNRYSEALQFKMEHGGKICQLIGSYGGGN